MGERGPVGSPFGRRAQDREKKFRVVGKRPPGEPPAAARRVSVRMPRYVRDVPEARRFWREHVHTLEDYGRLEAIHRQTFARLCLTYARIRDFEQRIALEGAVLEGPRGGKAKHPLLTPLRQAEQSFAELASRFGLDPKSAMRLPQPARAEMTRRERLLQ